MQNVRPDPDLFGSFPWICIPQLTSVRYSGWYQVRKDILCNRKLRILCESIDTDPIDCYCLAPVAQLDRVPGFEPGGREFESLRARHI